MLFQYFEKFIFIDFNSSDNDRSMLMRQKMLTRIRLYDREWQGREVCTKKRDVRAKLLFCLLNLKETLRFNDETATRTSKKTKGFISKTTTLHSFLYISLSILNDYDVKMPNFVFYGERKQTTTKFYFGFWTWIWSLGIQIQEDSRILDKVNN